MLAFQKLWLAHNPSFHFENFFLKGRKTVRNLGLAFQKLGLANNPSFHSKNFFSEEENHKEPRVSISKVRVSSKP